MAVQELALEEMIPRRAGGVLVPRGRLQIEPQIRYGHSTVNRVEITGYTILPAITLGVLDVTKRDTSSLTTSLGIRYGLLDRLEVDLDVPFIAGWSQFQLYPTNTAQERRTELSANGYNIGDIRLGLRTQLNDTTPTRPAFVAGLSARFPSGTNPYSVPRNPQEEQYIEKELPTGTGFYALSPTVSFVYPTEPAAIFGSLRYSWNIERDVADLNPETQVPYGTIDPGDVIAAGVGMGLSLNDQFSMMFSYDHSLVLKTQQDGQDVIGSSQLQIGTLGLGAVWRSRPNRVYNIFFGFGLTDDAPDVSVGLRMPMTYDPNFDLVNFFTGK